MKILYLILILFFTVQLSGEENRSLQPSDIPKIMHEIYSQHVDKKKTDAASLKAALQSYIDQFDPYRIYLLEKEVTPFLQMSSTEQEDLLRNYEKSQFSQFTALNDQIQHAIVRARTIRDELTANPGKLFATVQPQERSYDFNDDPDLRRPFVQDEQSLKDSIRNHIASFINGERKLYGSEKINSHQSGTLKIYENYLEHKENPYLYKDDNGTPLTTDRQQHIFTLYILKALTAGLDAHTTFFDTAEAHNMKERLEKTFSGIGVVLQQNNNGEFIIRKLIAGGSAAASNKILPKDQIIAINGLDITNETLKKVVDQLKGVNGSKVTLQLKRNGNNGDFSVTLNRTPVAEQSDRVDVRSHTLEDGDKIGIIKLHSFYQGENGITSENDVKEAISNLSKDGKLRGLVLDLRNNSGGFLIQSVKVAGLFITNGVIVMAKYSDGSEHVYRDTDGKIFYNGPLVILTSRETASAAEIVAEALQDYGVALVAGDEQTYGKGTIQSQTVTNNQASSFFKVTVGKYYTVSGHTPQIKGVKADILVPGPYNNERIGEQYLSNTLPNDTIEPEYSDDLSDVELGLKPWYTHYYLPSLQHERKNLKDLKSQLQERSSKRISENSNYQTLLKKGEENDSKAKKQLLKLQENEAVQIVQDMIQLSSTKAIAK